MRFPAASLVVFAVLPLAWLACGGGKKAPDSPSAESTSDEGGSSASPTASSAPTGSGESSSSSAPAASAPASTASAAPAASAPAFGSSPCGQCIDKACAKQLKACGNNKDCQSAVDSVHSCGSDKGASTCVSSAPAPSTGKPKKLFDAYTKCAATATASKDCNASCQ